MDPRAAEGAAVAYAAYRDYANGFHPVTGRMLPTFDQLAPAARRAWARVALAMKVFWETPKP